MKKTALNVFANGQHAGQLTRSDREEDTILFDYDRNCPAGNAVSITMPVRADQYDAMAGLLPIFEMNLPEGQLRETLRNRFAKVIPEFDDLDLLAIVGTSQIGRLRYSQESEITENVPEQSIEEILTYKGSADLFAHLLERFATYSGISGVQPKVLVRDTGSLPERLTHRGATHIIKAFDAGRFPELAANEYICTVGAAAAGIDTARVRLSENRQFLIVERFDRLADGAYLGIEDFCVLDGRQAHGRYDGSYESIARRIGDFVSPEKLANAREQFARTVAYACAIENGDAHLKNFSVLYQNPESSVALAPAYDMVATTPHMARDTLALLLNGSKAFPERAQLVKFVRQTTGMTEQAANDLLSDTKRGVKAAIRSAKTYSRKHRNAARFTETLVGAITRGCERSLGERP